MFGWLANQNARVYIKNDSFFIKHNEYTYPKGRALMQMYRTVSQTKEEIDTAKDTNVKPV